MHSENNIFNPILLYSNAIVSCDVDDEQGRLAELLQREGVDVIQTEGGKCSTPSKPGVLGLIEKVETIILNLQ